MEPILFRPPLGTAAAVLATGAVTCLRGCDAATGVPLVAGS